MFERFMASARRVVVLAQQEARVFKHSYIGAEHLLLGLVGEEEGVAPRVLESLGLTPEGVRAQVAEIVGSGEEPSPAQLPFDPRAKRVLELSLRKALSLGHNYIGTEHILLALVRENEGVAAGILLDCDADSKKITSKVIEMLSGRPRASAGFEGFQRFTGRAREVVVRAQEEARSLQHDHVGTGHILLGLLGAEDGVAARVLESLDVTVERVRTHVADMLGPGEEVTHGQIPFGPRAKKILELSLREALSRGHNYIGTEHILLALVRENEGVAAGILLDCDADPEKIRNEVVCILSEPSRRQRSPASTGAQRDEPRAAAARARGEVTTGWETLDLGALCDEELEDLLQGMTQREEKISRRRHLLHGKIDILRAELEKRLKRRPQGDS